MDRLKIAVFEARSTVWPIDQRLFRRGGIRYNRACQDRGQRTWITTTSSPIEDGKRGGRPCVCGSRISVADRPRSGSPRVFRTSKYSRTILSLTETDIRSCLAYAADRERRSGYRREMKLLFESEFELQTLRATCQNFSGSNSGASRWTLRKACRPHDLGLRSGHNGFVLVSLDVDFADRAYAAWPAPQNVIWLRCGNQPTARIEKLLRDHAETIGDFESI